MYRDRAVTTQPAMDATGSAPVLAMPPATPARRMAAARKNTENLRVAPALSLLPAALQRWRPRVASFSQIPQTLLPQARPSRPGILVMFARARADSNLKQKVIAMVTRGPYHVEALLATQQSTLWGDPSYAVEKPATRFTAAPGGSFRLKQIPANYLDASARSWTAIFMPVASRDSWTPAVEWAMQNDGVAYDFAGALASPFVSSLRRRGADANASGRLSGLFCSEVRAGLCARRDNS